MTTNCLVRCHLVDILRHRLILDLSYYCTIYLVMHNRLQVVILCNISCKTQALAKHVNVFFHSRLSHYSHVIFHFAAAVNVARDSMRNNFITSELYVSNWYLPSWSPICEEIVSNWLKTLCVVHKKFTELAILKQPVNTSTSPHISNQLGTEYAC